MKRRKKNKIIKRIDGFLVIDISTPNNKNKYMLINEEDWIRIDSMNLHRICYDSTGYAVTKVDGRKAYVHRIVLGTGPFEVDHINRDKLDNRKHNLRHVTRAQNNANRIPTKRNKSGISGVSFRKSRGKWRARITVDGIEMSLGSYDSFEDARDARISAEIDVYGEHSFHWSAK